MPAQVHGSGFLYRMVRHLVGALVAVGQGRLPLGDITKRLEVGSSIAPGEGGLWRGYNVAPAKGLVLHQVGEAARRAGGLPFTALALPLAGALWAPEQLAPAQPPARACAP